MIDTIAMLLCVSGFTLLSFRQLKKGFAISAVGSAAWLLFAIQVQSVPLIIQSVCFLAASIRGYLKE